MIQLPMFEPSVTSLVAHPAPGGSGGDVVRSTATPARNVRTGDGRGKRDSSREAYHDLYDTDKLNKSQKWLLTWMHGRPGQDWTRAELVKATGWSSGAICGRVNELVKDGWLIELKRRPCSITGKRSHAVRLA